MTGNTDHSEAFGWLDEAAAVRDSAGLRRRLVVRRDDMVDCASNDYLGLAGDPRVLEKTGQALDIAVVANDHGLTDLDGRRPAPLR